MTPFMVVEELLEKVVLDVLSKLGGLSESGEEIGRAHV